jgi:hypothetical protein
MGRETLGKIIGEPVGVVLLQDALQPCAGHGKSWQSMTPPPGTYLLPVFRPEFFCPGKSSTGTISEQPPGLIDEFYGVPVGIIAFMERSGPQDIEPEPGLADMIGVQEIQHRTDRLR